LPASNANGSAGSSAARQENDMTATATRHHTPQDYRSHLKPIWCPGCGDFGVLSALYKALSTCSFDPEKTVIVSGIGCSSRLPGFVSTYGFHTVHGRVLPIATGIKAARPDLNVIGVGGDGDGYSIGAGHLPHCARRNPDITYIVMNNSTYGLTKGQVSPTSTVPLVSANAKLDPKRWKTTPYGMTEDSINPIAQAIALDISFVARGFSYRPNQLADILVAGLRHPGFALIDIFSPCPTFNQEQTDEYYKERTYDVPTDHDPTDRVKAFALAFSSEGFPVGIIYKHPQKPSMLHEQAALRQRFAQRGSLEQMIGRYQ
jgi:2-oxoglutarate/2-oxoacid ferredoxin oxidoreductase subunit beta